VYEFLTPFPYPFVDVRVDYEKQTRAAAVLVPAVLRGDWRRSDPLVAEGETLPGSPGMLLPFGNGASFSLSILLFPTVKPSRNTFFYVREGRTNHQNHCIF